MSILQTLRNSWWEAITQVSIIKPLSPFGIDGYVLHNQLPRFRKYDEISDEDLMDSVTITHAATGLALASGEDEAEAMEEAKLRVAKAVRNRGLEPNRDTLALVLRESGIRCTELLERLEKRRGK